MTRYDAAGHASTHISKPDESYLRITHLFPSILCTNQWPPIASEPVSSTEVDAKAKYPPQNPRGGFPVIQRRATAQPAIP
jgi:hypothetical protein